jgi:predicted MFS family arabinose efflux permease
MTRRRLMMGAEAIRAAALMLVPVLATAGALSLVWLGALAALAAVGTVVYSVAAPSLLPTLVPRSGLAAANSQLELARSAAFAAGPALGGMLVAWTGATPAFVLAAAGSLLACGLLSGLTEPPRLLAPRRRVVADILEGAAFTAGHPLLRPILLTAMAWNLSWFTLQSVFVLFALHHLGMTPATVGAAMAMYGVGMLTGALASPRLARRIRFGGLVVTGPVVSLVAAALMGLAVWVRQPGLVYAGFFLFGAGPIVWTISQTTLRQAVTPGHMLGRVSALMMMATFGSRPLGALLGGFVGAHWGLGAAVGLSCAGFAVQVGTVLLSPIPGLRVLPEMACQTTSQPLRA